MKMTKYKQQCTVHELGSVKWCMGIEECIYVATPVCGI